MKKNDDIRVTKVWRTPPRFRVPKILKAPDVRRPPVGRCIYCLNATVELKKEHAIPLGLSGNYILETASCAACATITGRFEQEVMRGGMWAARRLMDIKTRKRKVKLPDEFGVLVDPRAGDGEPRELHFADHPCPLATPIYPLPSILTGAPPNLLYPAMHVADLNPAWGRALEPGTEIAVDYDLSPIAFARMLAKAAHTIAVAEFGLDGFRPYLIPFILGSDESDGGRFVGTYPGQPKSMGLTHYAKCSPMVERSDTGWHFVGCALRLFAFADTPMQLIIVGEFTAPGLEIWNRAHPETAMTPPALS